jgi:hypothetical protein
MIFPSTLLRKTASNGALITDSKQKPNDNFCNSSIVLLHIQQLLYTFLGLFYYLTVCINTKIHKFLPSQSGVIDKKKLEISAMKFSPLL